MSQILPAPWRVSIHSRSNCPSTEVIAAITRDIESGYLSPAVAEEIAVRLKEKGCTAAAQKVRAAVKAKTAPEMGHIDLPIPPRACADVNDLPVTEREEVARAIEREGDMRVLCSLANREASRGHYYAAARLAGAAAAIKWFYWYTYDTKHGFRRWEGIPRPDFRADHQGLRSFVSPPTPAIAANLAYMTIDELRAIPLLKYATRIESRDRPRISLESETGPVHSLSEFLASIAAFKARYIALELQRVRDNGCTFDGFATSPCNPKGVARIDEGPPPVAVAPLEGTVATRSPIRRAPWIPRFRSALGGGS